MAKKHNATSSTGAKPARKGAGARANSPMGPDEVKKMTARASDESAERALSAAQKKKSSSKASAASPTEQDPPPKPVATGTASAAPVEARDTSAPAQAAVAPSASNQPGETPATAMAPEEREQMATLGGESSAPLSREDMIALAAYLRAEARGFVGGDPVEDWLAAEAEVDARLRQQAGM
jgi:hypothetical protein